LIADKSAKPREISIADKSARPTKKQGVATLVAISPSQINLLGQKKGIATLVAISPLQASLLFQETLPFFPSPD